jgi:hypothetical protein
MPLLYYVVLHHVSLKPNENMMAEQFISHSFSPDQLGLLIRQAVRQELAEYIPPVPPPNIPEVATRKQAAEILGVSVVTLSTWEREGILIPNRIGYRVRYMKADILEALNRRKKNNHKR